MNFRKIFLICIFAVSSFGLIACADNAIPHDNFLLLLRRSIGDTPKESRLLGGQSPNMISRLANGHDEYRYIWPNRGVRPPCTIIFEVDPKTEKVINADYEGDKKGCAVVP